MEKGYQQTSSVTNILDHTGTKKDPDTMTYNVCNAIYLKPRIYIVHVYINCRLFPTTHMHQIMKT